MRVVASADLIYDPNDVGSDLVVACLISHSPRASDPAFDPQPDEGLSVVDADGEDLRARVVHREGDVVWVQLEVPGLGATDRSRSSSTG